MSDIEQQIAARPRDLGGFHVNRVLPALRKRSVGPFVFLDHMGPVEHGEIIVRPHPHINLATVTYLFDGEIHHRDSLGSSRVIQPGAINWMTAGKGIVHSERSDQPMNLHGLQLWVGLPRSDEDGAPTFDHYPAASLPVYEDRGITMRILAGSFYGQTSPVKTKSPLFYLDIRLDDGIRFELSPDYRERAVYVISGALNTSTERIEPQRMAVVTPGTSPTLVADGDTRFVVLGGEPLDGPRYIWWNFVSSDRDRIISAAHDWRAGGFPKVPGDDVDFIPAPDEDPHFAQSYHPPTDDEMRKILVEAKTIAMVGASNSPDKPSYAIMKHLLAAGYRVIPVNPKETEVQGQRAVASLADITEKVDIVDVFRRSEDTPPIADQAVKLGAKVLWLQLGVSNDEAAARALAGGLTVIMNTCIGATHHRLQVPAKT